MAHLVLINIPSAAAKKTYDKAFTFARIVNFGLLSLATHLSSHGISVRILDLCIYSEGDQWKDVFSVVREEDPIAIGLSCISGFNYPIFKETSRIIKTSFPKIKIIAGGKDHVGLIPKLVLSECREIDILVKGEGELVALDTMNSLINRKPISHIPNIAYRDETGTIVETISDDSYILDEIPSLDYTLYPRYLSFPPSIEVSRGCPYSSCAFCVSTNKKVRKKSIDQVIQDVKTIKHLYQIDEPRIYFETPMLVFTNDEIEKLARVRNTEKLKFAWRTETRVEYLDAHSIDHLAAAGLKVVDLGLESASPEILAKAC